MKRIATLTVIGRDKTGVVARITNFLFQHNANIEALEGQVTRGQFSMTLQASWSKDGSSVQAAIKNGLAALAKTLSMEIKLRWLDPGRLQRMALFVTREPHCVEALLGSMNWRQLKAEPVVMVSNRRDLEPLSQTYELPFVYIPWHDRPAAEKRALQVLEETEADFVVLARFMKILSPDFVWRHKNKIINVHPSLLPSFPGPQAYRQAYEHGVKIIGATAHFVNMHLDEGPIIAQAGSPIRSNSTLAEIVKIGQKLETVALKKAVRLYLTRRLDVHWGVVTEL